MCCAGGVDLLACCGGVLLVCMFVACMFVACAAGGVLLVCMFVASIRVHDTKNQNREPKKLCLWYLLFRFFFAKMRFFTPKMRFFTLKIQKNAFFLHFFAKKFCHIKKKQYLCTVKQKKAFESITAKP